jgi:hypothetical protein
MGQVDGWYYPEEGKPYTIVACPRKDCPAQAKAQSIDGPWEISSECSFLLDDILDESKLPPRKSPQKRSYRQPKQSEIWAKTNGRCFYCGVELIYKLNFTVDHIIPRLNLGAEQLDNLVPACRNCNSTKGTKDIEQFRFHLAIQQFHKDTGIWFSSTQVEYLQSSGVNMEIPKIRFWFEDGVL